MKIVYQEKARKFLKKISTDDRKLIIKKIEQYSENPKSLENNVKKLKGYDNFYRLRIGNYRVIFDNNGNIINILAIGLRKDVYSRGLL